MEYYNSDIAKNASVELVWITRDNDEEAMEEWAKKEKFPWPTVKFKSVAKLDGINKLAPGGVPGYVLVDAEGNVLASKAGSSDPVKQKLKELTQGIEG